MKKLFTLFAISLVLVSPIVSCSSDDVSAKQAETDRNDLVIPEDGDNSNVKFNQLALYASATNVNVGTLVRFTTMLNGIDVTNEVTYYVNNIEVGGSSITSAYNGTFRVQAKLDGYLDSSIVTVVYGGGTNPNPNPTPTPTGNFIVNGQSFNVNLNVLVLNGAFINEAGQSHCAWSSFVVDNIENVTIGAIINFKTPFTITDPENNLGQIVFPNGNNETFEVIQQINSPVLNVQNATGTGTIHYGNNFSNTATTNSFTSNVTFGTNTLQVNYNGPFAYQNNAQQEQETQARPGAQTTNSIVKAKAYKSTKPFSLK